MATFADRLTELLNMKNVRRKDLAELLGVTYKTVNNYENGTREPNMEQLKRLADYFEVPLDYLTGRSDSIPTVSDEVGEVSPEETAFLKWVEDNLEGSFFYDFDKSPEDAKKHMMETLRLVWERERGRKPGQKQGE
ncbi:helix-turn-helix domain-containing protein [Alicyclobacillus sp. ALC3]|uniref:helix-turn-helix domain-containing protein n=1 Tax=Alicyclobacillus sp. ALC3 TaxID=2796143 RepID=UPI002379A6B0|nr:helix-turn-helix transcriptional regulator [Alicyclobacillus sp. ALC3]WDL98162.1 helix-turn-helix transcriptional regulator [Alicyclobacillus sp. ALC3]